VAIAIDGSSPAVVAGSTSGITTGAFTPPSNCVLWAFAQGDANNGSSDEALSFSDSASGSWSTPVQDNARGGAVVAASYRIIGTSPGSMTVTLNDNKGAVAQRLFVRVMTGTDLVNPQGATTTAGTASISITSTVANSWTWSVYLGSNATVTAGANTTMQDETAGFDSGDAVATFSATSTTPTPGSTVTLVESGGTAVHHVAVEMVPPNTTIPYNPQRTPQIRDYGEVWWLQRDRRDANTVGTAANPLPSPLDVAWQAGGGYWHLYNDTAVRDRHAYVQQRAYICDPSLLAPAAAVQYCPPRQAVQRDYGEVQWAQHRPTDITLLASALLENELLGGAETAKRHFPAIYDDRREVPEQRPYVSDPSLLLTAALEGVLLGGAETAKRNLPATHADRREMPQQRPYISDPSFYPTTTPTDPLTVAWGVGGTYWLIYNSAALDVDRRESPQQRRYISDPGLLASALLENELLGGAETVKRHQPATHADRREVPVWRLYISDPNLLTTALLENELLAGDHRHGTWFARPAAQITTRQFGAIDVPADPLQLTADLLRRILTPATHVDRRQAGQQPRRSVDQSTPRPPTVRATSTPAVAARRTSTAAVTARRTSTSDVEG
jgi:hypothetical protein